MGKLKTQRGGLYPLRSTFNAESNGTNPPLVSLLYVEKSTKHFLYFFQFFRFFSKTIKKSRENKKPSVGGYTPEEVHLMLNRMVPTPHSYLYYTWRNRQNIFCIFFKFLDFFFKNHQKKSGKQKTQRGGLYPLGSTFNAESNGTNPPLVSLLYVEKSTKQIQKIFIIFLFFQKNI